MKRRTIGALSSAATLALLATTVQAPATAAPPADPADRAANGSTARQDDRPDALESKRRELKKQAFEKVVNGEATVQERGGSRAVRVAPGQWAQYGVQSQDELFSILVEFGGTGSDDPSTAGPLHNQIPQPDRSSDNSTYWTGDFDRQHYLDMFFNGMPEQGGESFKDFYEEESSGRYTVDGDVSDWVSVDKPESAYGAGETQADMTAFINDTADAWYADQVEGTSPANVKDYLARFDKWDRYDYDGDGDFAEPDGYIDHFQAIHAGEGEEAGAPEWTIWSHRWAAGAGSTRPDGNGPQGYGQFGGVEIGDTGLWIRDYTTEPENGGLGVFAHEFGHDLGLPDLYERRGGENATAFWTLMSSGSWLGHGKDAIGTTPGHMGPWEKLVLGWLDYDVARTGEASTHKLGASYHATKKAQALVTILPKGSRSTTVGKAAEGEDFFYSGRGDDRTATVTSPAFTVPAAGQLGAQVKYDIEKDWDYAYAEVSRNGTSWTPLATNRSTTDDPQDANEGQGITGTSPGWVPLTADLSAYAGEQVQIRFRMVNDAAVNGLGLMVDAVTVGSALDEGAENGAPGWTMDKFLIAEKGQAVREFAHYYIAENRTYLGYDKTLAEGPYNFGWSRSEPNRVEHFPYQDGMLVWYWNTSYGDNDVTGHLGAGEVLPVDARGSALTWSDGTVARNRIQAFDATFGLDATDPISLHRETATGMSTLQVPARAAVPVFDDSQASRYYDAKDNPQGGVLVPDTGTHIKVVNTNRNGMMQVRVY